MTPSPQSPGLFNWILLLGLGVIWGAAFMSVAVALEGFGPITVAALRVTLGAAGLWAIAVAMGQPLKTIPANGRFHVIYVGVAATALPFMLLSWGITHVPSAFAGIAMGALPILMVPLVWWFSPEEGIGPRRIIGLIVGFVGLAILMGPGAVTEGGPMATWGRIACLAASFCYAFGSIVTRRAPKIPPVAFGAGTLVAAAVALVPLALYFEGWPEAWPLKPMLAVLYAALLPTALASVIRVRIITTAGSLFMSLVNYMVPVWAAVFGVVLLNEALPPQLYTALALILAGIAIAQSRQIGAMFRR